MPTILHPEKKSQLLEWNTEQGGEIEQEEKKSKFQHLLSELIKNLEQTVSGYPEELQNVYFQAKKIMYSDEVLSFAVSFFSKFQKIDLNIDSSCVEMGTFYTHSRCLERGLRVSHLIGRVEIGCFEYDITMRVRALGCILVRGFRFESVPIKKWEIGEFEKGDIVGKPNLKIGQFLEGGKTLSHKGNMQQLFQVTMDEHLSFFFQNLSQIPSSS